MPLPPSVKIIARFNGKELEGTENTSRFFGNPFDGMISPRNHRRAWTLPAEFMVDGMNKLELKVASGDSINVIYIDVAME